MVNLQTQETSNKIQWCVCQQVKNYYCFCCKKVINIRQLKTLRDYDQNQKQNFELFLVYWAEFACFRELHWRIMNFQHLPYYLLGSYTILANLLLVCGVNMTKRGLGLANYEAFSITREHSAGIPKAHVQKWNHLHWSWWPFLPQSIFFIRLSFSPMGPVRFINLESLCSF